MTSSMQAIKNRLSQPNMSPFALDPEQAQTAIVNLDHLRAYRIKGEDATSFLQGQFTNDVNSVTEEQAQLSAYCTPKGRMLATFYLCRWKNDYILICPTTIAESFIARLSMYIMRAKVIIEEATDELILGVISPDHHWLSQCPSISPLAATIDNSQQNAYQAITTDQIMCFSVPGPIPRYIILCQSCDCGEIVDSLQQINPIYPEAVWAQMDILSGTPWIGANTQELFVPQMTNMELIDGVSFSKGCYPGQEVVARLHYLGHANRRMFRFSCISERSLAAGDDIFCDQSQQPVGKILNVEKNDERQWVGLAVVRIDNIQNDNLYCHDDQLTILNLPYHVPLEANNK